MEDTFLAWFPGAPGTQIAMFHTFFNVLFTLLFCPFINVFVFVATKVIPDKKEESHTTFIDERFLSTPAVALTQVTKEVARLMRKSAKIKETIRKQFIITQNMIFTSFFDNLFESLYTPKSMENFRNALYTYRNFIGVTDDYTFFNDYYINKMAALEERYENIPNKPMALVPIKDTILARAIRKIRTLVRLNTKRGYNYNYNYNDINMK